jgi:ABC-type dipeptide/oligopeptide/nickel transport system permease subunit
LTEHPYDHPEVGTITSASGAGGPAAVGNITQPGEAVEMTREMALTYESGMEIQPHSQWWYIRRRFMRHRVAVASLVLLLIVFLAGAFAGVVAPYSFDQPDFNNAAVGPTFHGWHIFGTDLLGRDYFSRVIYGIRTSEQVALLVASVSTAIGVVIGAVAGYYGGLTDNLLMRLTDLFLTLPGLAVLLTVAAFVKTSSIVVIALILALLFWTTVARIVRGTFLSLREKEYVEAARAAGSGDARIMFRHMLPNAMGPIIVNATLTAGLAIITEAALAFLGFGIRPPTPALGKLISDGQGAAANEWWLVVFPGLAILLIVLFINFVGDGLRDALDPTQRKVRA